MTPEVNPAIEPAALGLKQAAEYIAVSRVTLYRLREKGELKSFHVGRKMLFTREELNRFIERQERAEAVKYGRL